MSEYSKKEIKKIQSDARYWERVGKILGLKLSGFTGRSGANLYRVTEFNQWRTYDFDGVLAERILELNKIAKRAK